MPVKSPIPGATLVEQFRDPHSKADYYAPNEGTKYVYVDGMGTLSFSASVAKVDLFVTEKITEEKDYTVEHRLVTHRIIMPIGPFTEMCAKALGGMAQAKEPMSAAFDQLKETISKYGTPQLPEGELKVSKP